MGITRRVQRRTFFRESLVTAGALAFPFLFARRARAFSVGPLVSDPAGRLDLPEGFSYTVVDAGGQTMSDGYRVPGNPDGMACFERSDGALVLLRNHELTASSRGPYASGMAPPEAYDSAVVGGVTRVVLDRTTFARVSSNLVLAGTAQNCAGGPSPWGWLSCEEAFDSLHGYTFVCPIGASSVATPQRVVGYGHFRHEAVAIDPVGNVAYLTEDRPDSALYRFVPEDPATPFSGTLQALKVRGQDALDTSTGLGAGDELEVEWVDLENPNPASDTLRNTAHAAGAAVFRRGEGIWFDRGVVYFTCTAGGPLGSGQVFALRPTASGGTLALLAQSEDPAVLDGPDNLCAAPFGDLFVGEDGVNGGDFFVRGITPAGAIYDFARTTISELAGLCFSPDGRALFVNIYGADMTLVVTGPFPTRDPGGGGGQGGQGEGGEGGASDGAGAPGAGRPAEGGAPAGGAPTRGGSSSGGNSGTTGGTTGEAGEGLGASSGDGGGSGAGGGQGEGAGPAARTSGDDPGCGCAVPGRR